MDSNDESSADNNDDDKSTSIDDLENMWEGNRKHPNINARDIRLKICDRIRQTKSEWKGAELPTKWMGNVLHKVFNVIVK